MVTDLVLIVIVAIIAQTVVEQLKNTVKFHNGKYYKGKINLKSIASIIVSVLMCLCYKCDIMVLLGLTSSIPVVGYLITVSLPNLCPTSLFSLTHPQSHSLLSFIALSIYSLYLITVLPQSHLHRYWW